MKSVDVGTAINLALELLIQAQRINTLVAAAQASNRTKLSAEEVKVIREARQAAFEKLDAAIETAETEGR